MGYQRWVAGAVVVVLCAPVQADTVTGTITDLNGRRVAGASVTLTPTGLPGPTALTVFSDQEGRFTFPDRPDYGDPARLNVTARALNHRLLQAKGTAIRKRPCGVDAAGPAHHQPGRDGARLGVVERISRPRSNVFLRAGLHGLPPGPHEPLPRLRERDCRRAWNRSRGYLAPRFPRTDPVHELPICLGIRPQRQCAGQRCGERVFRGSWRSGCWNTWRAASRAA